MSTVPIHAGWNSIDDGDTVLVRQAEPHASLATHGPAFEITAGNPAPHPERAMNAPKANPLLMRFSALLGIGIVCFVASLYFGLVNLQGDISGSTATPTVTVTKDGHFSPAAITVAPGGTFALQNERTDPQVIKAKSGHELFPVQIVFTEPSTVTIPADATEGSYTYGSETLPDTEVLTITVAKPEAATAPSSAASSAASTETQNMSVDIPLPFGTDAPSGVPQSALRTEPTTSEGTHAAAPTIVPSTPSSEPSSATTNSMGDIAVINLSGTSDIPDTVSIDNSAAIPVNPYTVAAGKKNPLPKQTLHAGAPLTELRTHTPRRTPGTGPDGLWIIFTIASLGLGVMYARSLKSFGL